MTPRSRVARAVAIFLMGAIAGNALALLGGGYLLDHLGHGGRVTVPLIGQLSSWRLLFLLACVPGIMVAVAIMTIRETKQRTEFVFPWQALADARRHLRDHAQAYGFLTTATAAVLVLSQAQAAWMPLFYARYFHLAPGTSAMTVGVMLLVSAPTGQWIGGILIDALHRKGIVSATHVVQACCMLACIPFALIFCLTRQLWVSEIAYVLFSAIVFAATPAGLTGWQLLTPERSRGLLIGLLLAVASLIGLGLGPAGVGMLTDHVFQDEHAMYLALLMVILAAAIAGSLSALLGMRAFALSCGLTASAGSIDADTLGHRARA